MILSATQRANATTRRAQTMQQRRERGVTEVDWDEAIARLRDMLDEREKR